MSYLAITLLWGGCTYGVYAGTGRNTLDDYEYRRRLLLVGGEDDDAGVPMGELVLWNWIVI